MFKPEGIFSAMLTPFNKEDDINEVELRKLVNFQINGGLNGLFPVSSVGEFVHLSLKQCIQLMEIVADEAKGRVPITPGVSASCAENSIYLAKKARELNCDAVVICPPYYYPLNDEMIERHFEAVIESVDIPVIVYNIPLFSSKIGYDVVKRLSRYENVVGMKDSSGSMVDLMHFNDKVRLGGGNLNILVGREEMLYPALTVGAKGCMTCTAGIVPEVMSDIYKYWKNGNCAEALKLQVELLQLIRAMASMPIPVGFKIALELRGFEMGPNKQPLSDAVQYQYQGTKARIQKLLKKLLVENGYEYTLK